MATPSKSLKGRAAAQVGSHLQISIIYKLGFNQNYFTFTLILLTQILSCGRFPWTEFINYKCFDIRSDNPTATAPVANVSHHIDSVSRRASSVPRRVSNDPSTVEAQVCPLASDVFLSRLEGFVSLPAVRASCLAIAGSPQARKPGIPQDERGKLQMRLAIARSPQDRKPSSRGGEIATPGFLFGLRAS